MMYSFNENQIKWATKYMRNFFFFLKFFSPTNAYAIYNGADEWSKCLVATSEKCSHKLLSRQCGGSVMFWVGIISGKVVGSWQVPDGITT